MTSPETSTSVATNFVLSQVGGNGLLSIPKSYREDWARQYPEGENIEANAILYAPLLGGAQLADVKNDSTSASDWRARAAKLKSAVNARLWNPAVGLYRDNPTSTLYPQDGDSLAVWYNLTDSPAKDSSIVRALTARWNHMGALTPEKNDGGKARAATSLRPTRRRPAAGADARPRTTRARCPGDSRWPSVRTEPSSTRPSVAAPRAPLRLLAGLIRSTTSRSPASSPDLVGPGKGAPMGCPFPPP